MQTAQGACQWVPRHARLRHRTIDAMRGELALTPSAPEEPARVVMAFHFYQPNAANLQRDEFHARSAAALSSAAMFM